VKLLNQLHCKTLTTLHGVQATKSLLSARLFYTDVMILSDVDLCPIS